MGFSLKNLNSVVKKSLDFMKDKATVEKVINNLPNLVQEAQKKFLVVSDHIKKVSNVVREQIAVKEETPIAIKSEPQNAKDETPIIINGEPQIIKDDVTVAVDNKIKSAVPETKVLRLVVLTESAKYGGLCVSGFDIENKQLIRLVSDESGAEISKDDFRFNNFPINIFDILEVECIPCPLKIQKENYILKKILRKRQKPADISAFDQIFQTLKNGNLLYSQYCYIKEEFLNRAHGSLMLAKVKDLTLFTMQNNTGAAKTKANFTYNGRSYTDYAITDPDYFGNDTHIDNAIIIISIPEKPYNEKYYKFIAKIFVASI